MDDWLLDIIETAGYLGIVLLMILENIVPAIPSELILPFAGFLTAGGKLHPAGVIAAATAGSTVGALAWYVLARRWGEERMTRFVARHGRWLLIDESDVTRAERWFERHERAATFLARLIPGVRTLISLPAGLARMPVLPFLAYTVAGTLVWTSALTLAGHLLAGAYEKARDVVGPLGTIVFGGFLLFLVGRQVMRRRAARTARGRA